MVRFGLGVGIALIALAIVRELWPTGSVRPLLDPHRRIVIYHGLNVANHAKSTPDFVSNWKREDLARLNEWGFNLVRYLVFWEAIEPVPGHINEEYLRKTMERIDWLAELGIDVVIDLHQDLFARRFGGNGFPGWAVHDGGAPFSKRTPWVWNYFEPAVWNSFDHFWGDPSLQRDYVNAVKTVMELVEKRPNVIGVDIINEPWPWRGLGFERGPLTAFYAKVESMRREQGFRVPLFFAPMLPTNAGFRSGLRAAPGPGSVYAFHYYDPLCDAGWAYRWFNHVWMWRTVRVRIREASRMGVPLFMGEFGLQPSIPGFRKSLDDFTRLLEEHGIGWAYWSYDRNSFGLLDKQGLPGPAMDALIQVYAQRVAGRNLKIVRGRTSFEIAFDPVPTQAPTEIFVPGNLRGVRVTVNGIAIAYSSLQPFKHWNTSSADRQSIRIEWE